MATFGRYLRNALSLIVLVALMAACASSTPPFSYGGTWTGTMMDNYAGLGSTTITLSQSGSDLLGTWQATFSGGDNGGTLAGIVNGNEIIVELYPSDPTTCPYAVVAQRTGSTLEGTYAAYDCTVTVTGTVNVTKQ